MIIFYQFVFVLQYVDYYGCLVVFVGGEFLGVCYWDGGIVWNYFFYQFVYGFQVE